MSENYSNLKMAVIAGAAEALKHKSQNPKKTDEDVIEHITKSVEDIIEKIDQIIFNNAYILE